MRFALLLPLALLAACVTTPAAPSLAGSYWSLVSLPGRDITTATRHPSLGFEPGRAHGSTGCNGWGAPYTQNGNDLHFGPAITTKMACVTGMDVESAFSSAITNTAHVSIEGDTLTLRDSSGAELARFTRSVPMGS